MMMRYIISHYIIIINRTILSTHNVYTVHKEPLSQLCIAMVNCKTNADMTR